MRWDKLTQYARNLRWTIADLSGLHGEPVIGTPPYLEENALERWRKLVANSNVYLEYGSGGSTVEAVQVATHVVTVESDRRYLSAVERRVASTPGATKSFHPIHGNIGLTTAWGYPLVTRKSLARLDRWQRYTSSPWSLLDKLELVPDFILVDGRFRAACVLQSFLRLPAHSDCLFMIDDFKRRSSRYGAFLPFATDLEYVDEALMFRRLPDFDRDECRRLLEDRLRDPK
jgi:hypothetical protein